MKHGTGRKKTSLAFREVAVIPKLGRLYTLSVVSIADRFRLSLLECKFPSLSDPAASYDVKLSRTLQYML